MPTKKKLTKDAVEKVAAEQAKKNQDANFELAKKAIIKKYGEIVSTLGDHEDVNIPTISTGSIGLDIALGRGGMGLGRIYEVYGPSSGGKSTLGVHVCIQAQRRGMRALYIDAEHAVDPILFRNYGVNLKELQLVQGYDGEQNLEVLETFVKSGAFKVAIVDSVSALMPRKESEDDIEKAQVGNHAKLMSKALRRITPIANSTGTLIIFVNQLRMKIGGYGNPETTTGGVGLGFYATGRISVRGPEAIARRIKDKVTDEVIGHTTEFEIVKNKLAAPFKKAEVNLIYGKGYDYHWETLNLAESLGIIDKTGAWYKINGQNIAQGELNAVQYLRDNEDSYVEIRKTILDQLGLKEIYERHSNPGPIVS
jgi:recombination protein RecA